MAGPRGEPRIVVLEDHSVEVPPARHMLVVRNDDRPGMIAHVTNALREINIEDMHVGRSPEGESAMMVLATSTPVPPELVESLRGAAGIHSVHALRLP